MIDRERRYRRLAATVGCLAFALQYYLALRLATRNGASLAVAFWGMGLCAVALDRRLARRQ